MKYDIQSLKEKLNLLDVRPNKKLGQNFLINQSVCEKIVNAALQFGPKKIIEVGPGLGALTELLQDYKNQMTLIELDRSFAQYWVEKGFEVLNEDALKLDWTDLVGEGVGLISNLPYQISSSLVIDRSIDKNSIDFMVLMFQKEVAQRLQAKPKTEDYGLLTVIAQVFWDVEFLMEVGPKDFYPPPSIASRVLVFKNKKTKIENPKRFLNFVKEAFKQRRKLMVSNIGGIVDKEKSKASLVRMGFTEMARSEELSPQDFIKLYEDIYVSVKI